jgi:uncharacterized protein YbaR (Trm112 family)
MALSPELLEILRCPKCVHEGREGLLELSPTGGDLSCAACRLRYAIEDDIPNMLIDEATPF